MKVASTRADARPSKDTGMSPGPELLVGCMMHDRYCMLRKIEAYANQPGGNEGAGVAQDKVEWFRSC